MAGACGGRGGERGAAGSEAPVPDVPGAEADEVQGTAQYGGGMATCCPSC